MLTSQYYNFWRYWELRHKVTFDGPNRLILVNYGETTLDVETEIYSDWKEWIHLEDYSKYPQAISVIGGEPLGAGQFVGATYFLENGWRIRPWEGTHTLTIDGNIYTREAGQSPSIPTLGAWSVNTTYVRSALVFQVATGGSSSSVSINANDIAQAVWNYSTTASLNTDSFGEHVFTKVMTFAQYLATK